MTDRREIKKLFEEKYQDVTLNEKVIAVEFAGIIANIVRKEMSELIRANQKIAEQAVNQRDKYKDLLIANKKQIAELIKLIEQINDELKVEL